MKLRAVLNGIAALCTIGAFYTFAFCMVDNVNDAEISKEYYYNTATETSEQETEASAQKAEAPMNILGVIGNNKNSAYLPDTSDDERVRSHIANNTHYQANRDDSEIDAYTATPLYTAPEITTSVPDSAEDTTATESAGADADIAQNDAEFDNVPEESDDIIVSENNLNEAVVDNNDAFADETAPQPDLLSELDRQQSQAAIRQKLNEMQSAYDTQATSVPASTVDFWSSYYPSDTNTVTSSGTFFETIPTFTEAVPSETEPVFGCREFSVKRLELTEKFPIDEISPLLAGDRDLGIMLYGMKFRDGGMPVNGKFSDAADAVYYHPHLIDGVINVAEYRRDTLC